MQRQEYKFPFLFAKKVYAYIPLLQNTAGWEVFITAGYGNRLISSGCVASVNIAGSQPAVIHTHHSRLMAVMVSLLIFHAKFARFVVKHF